MTKRLLQVTALISVAVVALTAWRWSRAVSPRQVAEQAFEQKPAPDWSGTDTWIDNLRERLRTAPGDPDLSAALGHVYLQKVRETNDPTLYAMAERLFEAGLKRDDNHLESILGKAALAAARHEFESARSLAQQAIELSPGSPAAYGILADASVEVGDYDAALAALTNMVNLKPGLSSYSRISYLRELHGDIEGAISAMQMAVRSGGPKSENTAWCMVHLGQLYLSSGRPDEAEAVYTAALRQFPNYAYAYAGLARVKVSRGQFDPAAQYYTKAIERIPLPEFLVGLGEVYLRTGRPAEAEQQFRLVRAIQRIERANGVQPDAEMLLFALDHGQDPDPLVTDARKQFRNRPSIKTADALAWALYRDKQYSEAEQIAAMALRLGTRDPLYWYHAGMIAYSVGNYSKATELLRRALAQNPGFSPVHAAEAEAIVSRFSVQQRTNRLIHNKTN